MTWLGPLALLAVSACMSSMQHEPLQVASNTPAAEGKVGIKRTDQGNMKLNVAVKYLAPPSKVAPGTTVYVVWAEDPSGKGAPTNLGVLRVTGDREGKLETMTVARQVKITLTPEVTASLRKPAHQPVMWTTVSPWQ